LPFEFDFTGMNRNYLFTFLQ